MGHFKTKFQEEVFGGQYMERLPKEAVNGALFIGEIKIRGKALPFELHKASERAKSDFLVAVQSPDKKWHSFGHAGWKDSVTGGPYLEIRVQNRAFNVDFTVYTAWPTEDQPKEKKPEDAPVYYDVKMSEGGGRKRGAASNPFGFDDAIPY